MMMMMMMMMMMDDNDGNDDADDDDNRPLPLQTNRQLPTQDNTDNTDNRHSTKRRHGAAAACAAPTEQNNTHTHTTSNVQLHTWAPPTAAWHVVPDSHSLSAVQVSPACSAHAPVVVHWPLVQPAVYAHTGGVHGNSSQ